VLSTGHHRSSIGTIGRASANEPTAGHVGSARSAQTSTPPPNASRRRTVFHPKLPYNEGAKCQISSTRLGLPVGNKRSARAKPSIPGQFPSL
jgi:hypothetical protein